MSENCSFIIRYRNDMETKCKNIALNMDIWLIFRLHDFMHLKILLFVDWFDKTFAQKEC